MKISTGLPLFNTPVDPQGTENQPDHAIFWAGSKSLTSHVIDVTETPIIVKAYGFLTDASTITVCTATTGRGNSLSLSPMILNGHTVQLSKRNNVLVLDLTGKYYFVLSDGLGQTSCFYHESGLPLWSFGLAAYAIANGMIQFVETETIKPVMDENTIRLYAKVSNDTTNLINVRHTPLITDDPIPDPIGNPTGVDEYDIGGLYLGPTAAIGNQYVSSSTGDDNNDGKGPNTPIRSIQFALSRIVDGTIANIFLKAGDTFCTYLSGLTPGQPPTNGVPPPGDVVDMPTFQAAQAAVAVQKLLIGNRQIYFYPYGDTPVTDIINYNNTYGTGYNAYTTRESNWPTIKFIMLHITSTNQYLPVSMPCGIAGALNFSAINLQVGVTGVSNPSYINGCIPGNGAIAMTGGNIKLAGVPLLGNNNGAGLQSFASAHVQVSNAVGSITPKFNISGTYLSTSTYTSYAYSPTNFVVPASAPGGALPYTDNADNVEYFLAPKSLWDTMKIYSRQTRSYRRVRTDMVIGVVGDEEPAPPAGLPNPPV